jgi:hypothetical protein
MAYVKVPFHISSNIADAAYDASAKELLITFLRQGRRYLVHEISADIVEDFSHARSAGIFYNMYIRDSYEIEEV